MTDKNNKKLFEVLDELRKMQQEGLKQYEAENDAWWHGLTEQEREDAFYAVIKRMYKAEVEDRGTYRWALYNVFGFDMGMYGRGMDCGYLTLHNLVFDGLEKKEADKSES